jgi:hypothetical protein
MRGPADDARFRGEVDLPILPAEFREFGLFIKATN